MRVNMTPHADGIHQRGAQSCGIVDTLEAFGHQTTAHSDASVPVFALLGETVVGVARAHVRVSCGVVLLREVCNLDPQRNELLTRAERVARDTVTNGLAVLCYFLQIPDGME
jgi:hypothetical protein